MLPLPNPSFEPETHRWRPGAVAPSREVPSQICAVLGQKQPFFTQNSPQTRAKRPNEGKRWHVRLDFTVSKSPLVPFKSAICPKERPKKAPKSPKICAMSTNPPKPSTGRILGYVRGSKSEFRGHLVHPQPPHFMWFPSLRSQNALLVGCFGNTTGSKMGQKRIFPQVILDHLGMLKQVVLAHFEPVVTRFGQWKTPICLEKGPFWEQKWVRNGSKTRFSKGDPGPLGVQKQLK